MNGMVVVSTCKVGPSSDIRAQEHKLGGNL